MSARKGPKKHLPTESVLEAVHILGIRWTLLFADEEIISVNEALDRELIEGNLANAFSLSPQGEEQLRRSGGPHNRARLDLRVDHGCRQCRFDEPCWTVACLRCGGVDARHLREELLAPSVRAILRAHDCPGTRRAPAPEPTVVLEPDAVRLSV